MELLLFIIAWSLKILLSPVLVLYGLIRALCVKQTGAWLKSMAISVDILGNAMGKYIFDDFLRKKGGYPFGNRNETISCAMGYNEQKNTLKVFGRFVAWILNTCEKDHLKKSIPNNLN
jgi:8-oxo-dGTP diphosphatase